VNADLSVAPELAQLAASSVTAPPGHASASPRTHGRMAADLSRLAAAPRRWWDLVRFDHDGPARIPVPGADGAWLLVLPPGATADCDCRYATLLAGDACETPLPPPASPPPASPPPASPPPASPPPASPPLASPPLAAVRPLRPGRVRVHGRGAPHRVTGVGHGYSVSLHWTDATPRSEEIRDFYPERTVAALRADG
jgi:hypothetical protein